MFDIMQIIIAVIVLGTILIKLIGEWADYKNGK